MIIPIESVLDIILYILFFTVYGFSKTTNKKLGMLQWIGFLGKKPPESRR